MSELQKLLQAAGIARAVVVDDAYDEVPLANDLSIDTETWTQFFDDLTEEDKDLIRAIFPNYDNVRADELRSNDAFVSSIWSRRAEIRRQIIEPLFGRYEKDKADDLRYLGTLTTSLEGFGIQCERVGRVFTEKAAHADLIIIDLFLSSAQDQNALETAMGGLNAAISDRMSKPPIVILMSRSGRLEEKKKEFRDGSGLLESAFRIIRKAELGEEGKLARILTRLATHYPDSIKLATFLHEWREGLTNACARTANLIRTLDLADYAQIQQLLLSEEGEPTGSYLVDVFDRVLQHEVEREAKIIDAAIALNGLTSTRYPPPYVAGSRDLQILVFRSLFQNHERLRLAQAEDSRLGFGDILRRKPASAAVQLPEPAVQGDPNRPLAEIHTNQVLAVLTPACDLQRNGAKRILLLEGTLLPLEPATWSYAESPVRTPIIEMAAGERYWIKWDLKHIETINHSELETLLADPKGFSVIARLREACAVELQQKLLSSLGRVGLLAPMPATFPVRVEVCLPGADRKLFALTVPGLAVESGVCVVGRTGQKDMRLIFSEDDCEGICKAIASVPAEQIHSDARDLVRSSLESGELLTVMEKGIVLPSPQQDSYKEIVSRLEAIAGESPKERTIGLIRRSESVSGADLKPGEVKKAGIVLAVSDKPSA